MKLEKYFICKKTSYHLNGDRAFELGQKYEFVKTVGNITFLKLQDDRTPITKEFFKEYFKQKPVN